MAQPISLERPARDARQELRRRLDEAPMEHAEALLESYELLQQFHDRGVFQLLHGALGASDKLVEAAVDVAKREDSVRAMRNAIVLAKMLSSINPDILQGVAIAVGETLGCTKKPVIEPPSLLSLLGQFRRRELRRSIALINRFLETLGNQLNSRGGCT